MQKECEELAPRLSAYLDKELPDRDRLEVERHLKSCEACRELAHELEETAGVVKDVFSSDPAPEVDLTGVWEEIEKRIQFGPTLWQRIIRLVGKPTVWLPATVVATAAALLVFLLPTSVKHPPVELSRVESVYSRTGKVMVLQTPTSGRPLIWILPGAEKEVSS